MPLYFHLSRFKLTKDQAQALPCKISMLDRVVIQSDDQKLKIGLIWTGVEAFGNNHRRSLSLKDYKHLIQKNECHFFSLQENSDPIELDYCGLTDLRQEFKSVDQLATIIKSLDVVITVNTMIAHLSGALGIPTFMITNSLPDWRWGMESNKIAWYPSLTIFRKEKDDKDWMPAMTRVDKALKSLIMAKKLLSSDHLAKVQKLQKTGEHDQALKLLKPSLDLNDEHYLTLCSLSLFEQKEMSVAKQFAEKVFF